MTKQERAVIEAAMKWNKLDEVRRTTRAPSIAKQFMQWVRACRLLTDACAALAKARRRG